MEKGDFVNVDIYRGGSLEASYKGKIIAFMEANVQYSEKQIRKWFGKNVPSRTISNVRRVVINFKEDTDSYIITPFTSGYKYTILEDTQYHKERY